MHLPANELPPDPYAQRAIDRRRWLRAFKASLGFVLVLLLVFLLQGQADLRAWTVQPGSVPGLLGLLGAPLLHGSVEHLVANAISLLMLGTLAGAMYPRATPRALPLLWLGSGLAAWLLGIKASVIAEAMSTYRESATEHLRVPYNADILAE